MSNIKTRDVAKVTNKNSKNKSVKLKETIVNIKEKSEKATNSEEYNVSDYAINRISNPGKVVIDNSGKIKQKGNRSVRETKKNFIKVKQNVKSIKTKLAEKKKIKHTTKGIKTSSIFSKKEAQKVTKESVNASKKAAKMMKDRAKKAYRDVKFVVKTTIKTVKAIIAATKALISFLIAIGWGAIVAIIVICLIGLLCGSVFGIFFSGEKSNPNAMTMRDAIVECNQEFSNKLESIQNSNPHDDYVLEGNVANWKDILTIYAIKQSNGNNEQEIVTMDDNKKKVLKDIYWDMNIVTSEIKQEIVIEQGINTEEMPKEVQKKVLYIKINSKSAEDMKNEYYFTPAQIKQYNELYSDEYSSLWNNIVYGMDSGEYINWRQKNATWSTIRIGNTNSSISDIGCLVTSIAVLIQKSGVDTQDIIPFNPGTFVEALNKNSGFDGKGNLQYGAINKVIPNFKYINNVNLRGKTRTEKLELITQYFNNGYYLTVEVKGATPGNQHWVAIIGVNGNNIVMVDPATNHTDLWSAYEFSKTSQLNYFKLN